MTTKEKAVKRERFVPRISHPGCISIEVDPPLPVKEQKNWLHDEILCEAFEAHAETLCRHIEAQEKAIKRLMELGVMTVFDYEKEADIYCEWVER